MATLIAASKNAIEISLDGASDFNVLTDLVTMGLARNPTEGLMVRKITFIPSATGDSVVVRDGVGGPRIFSAIEVLGVYDILKDEYVGDRGQGKLMALYIDHTECSISLANQAYVIFEL